jgi:hypothetical protein
MSYDPKGEYQKFHKEEAERLRREVEQPYFRRALTFALAEMSTRQASTEQITGANVFVDTFLALGVKDEPVARFPEKRLKVLDKANEPDGGPIPQSEEPKKKTKK